MYILCSSIPIPYPLFESRAQGRGFGSSLPAAREKGVVFDVLHHILGARWGSPLEASDLSMNDHLDLYPFQVYQPR